MTCIEASPVGLAGADQIDRCINLVVDRDSLSAVVNDIGVYLACDDMSVGASGKG